MKKNVTPTSDQSPQDLFNEAEKLFQAGDFESASELYIELTSITSSAPYAYYRLAGIANAASEPERAKDLYYNAFALKPDICGDLLSKEHANNNYVFQKKKDEAAQENCPLCGLPGKAFWCYCTLEVSAAYYQQYNPVRLWMRCEECNHLFAGEFPENQYANTNTEDLERLPVEKLGMPTKREFFPYFNEILTKLTQFTAGTELFEIGIGGSECLLVAQEMAINAFGIDISAGNVVKAQKYGLNAELHDFVEFETDKKWDILILGDVIEHVSDPVLAMEKVSNLLKDDGVLWMSTPNFESAFSIVAGHGDPMRREASHKNYFSRFSLFGLMDRFELVPIDYRISKHYNGSMEVVVKKM